jgi:hypothetical protein
MKTPSIVLLLIASLASVLLGCSDRTDSVVSPQGNVSLAPTEEPARISLGKLGPWLNSVSGNVHQYYRLTPATHGKHWDVFGDITFSAHLDQDGIASGNCRLKNIGAGATLANGFFPDHSGKVVQLMVEESPELGRVAKIMYQATEGAELMEMFGPTPIGCIVVVDGGEGKNALPDCISYWIAIDSPEVMTAMGFYEMTPTEFLQLIAMLSGVVNGVDPVENGNVQIR